MFFDSDRTGLTAILNHKAAASLSLCVSGTDAPMTLVQCKAWRNKLARVALIRERLGVMMHEKVERGFFMISGEFLPEA